MNKQYDVIVIGAGHAGCEAALASARMGRATLMITMNLDQIAHMSCNPAIGGMAKGHLVREIDALGGEMGACIDATGIQFRVLNKSKGPAVHGYRAQADKMLYKAKMRRTLDSTPNLAIYQGQVKSLLVEGHSVLGVLTEIGDNIGAATVVLCSGTFLNGLTHTGFTQISAGRAGEPPALGLSDNLRELGFQIGRLKTGTCPRLDRDTIDFSSLEEQPGDDPPQRFSYFSKGIEQPQLPCHITYTTEQTQQVIERNLDRSPLFTGVIQGIGPRYCPSIEDKVKRFPEKRRHQIFLEPESLSTKEIYPNGLSTSLPIDVQREFLRTIPGLEKVEIMRAGYAIEYDYSPPTQLYPTLETKLIQGVYFAGQINGTSGYEEAAAQGIIAGINAALKSKGGEQIILTRQNSYIGVLIDDLVTKGTEEPYRMFTSRAEFRLLLRPDNADSRMCEIGRSVGLLDDAKYSIFLKRENRIRDCIRQIKSKTVKVQDAGGTRGRERSISAWEFLKRPEVSMEHPSFSGYAGLLSLDDREKIEVECKYEGYMSRQEKLVAKTKKSEGKRIPEDFDYSLAIGLSKEVQDKLTRIRPVNLGQASRISGITPAALSILHIYLEKQSIEKEKHDSIE